MRRVTHSAVFDWVRHGLAGLLAAAFVCQPILANAQSLRFIRDAEIEDLLADYAKPVFRAAGLGSQHVKVRVIQDNAFKVKQGMFNHWYDVVKKEVGMH